MPEGRFDIEATAEAVLSNMMPPKLARRPIIAITSIIGVFIVGTVENR